MNYTITLVSASNNLSIAHIARLESFLTQNGLLLTGSPKWLTPHIACDLTIAEMLNFEQIKNLREIFNEDKIDIFCTHTAGRKKKLLLADMDSTIVTSETLDELAAEAGIKDKIAGITERAMRGELDFHAAIKERVALLKGLSLEALERTLQATKISSGAEELIQTMNQSGFYTVLVSGGFTYFTQEIAKKLAFKAHHGNNLGIDGNRLSGEVIDPILDKDTKLNLLKHYVQELDVDMGDSVAIGDGANDLPMLQAAGLGIGYHPKPILEDNLINCIRHTDLKSVLYAQGYKLS